MMKEAAIFVVSAGALVYFITPEEKQSNPAPVAEEKAEKAKPDPVDSDDDWDDEEEDTEDDFVFGQSMIETGDDADDDTSEDDYKDGDSEGSRDEDETESSKRKKTVTAKVSRRPINPLSPRDGDVGSASNPKVLPTDNPKNGDDD